MESCPFNPFLRVEVEPAKSPGNQVFSPIYLLIVLVLVSLIVFRRFVAGSRHLKYAIVGPRKAGKTQLLYKLAQGAVCIKGPSGKNNQTTFQLNNREVPIVDVAGSAYCRLEFLQSIDQFTHILLLASEDQQKAAQNAADWVYSINIQKKLVRERTKIIIIRNLRSQARNLQTFRRQLDRQLLKIKDRNERRTSAVQNEMQQDLYVSGLLSPDSAELRILEFNVRDTSLQEIVNYLTSQ